MKTISVIKYLNHPRIKDSSKRLTDIEFWSGYGVVAPSRFTTNGDVSVIRNNIEPEDLPEFDAWLSNLPK